MAFYSKYKIKYDDVRKDVYNYYECQIQYDGAGDNSVFSTENFNDNASGWDLNGVGSDLVQITGGNLRFTHVGSSSERTAILQIGSNADRILDGSLIYLKIYAGSTLDNNITVGAYDDASSLITEETLTSASSNQTTAVAFDINDINGGYIEVKCTGSGVGTEISQLDKIEFIGHAPTILEGTENPNELKYNCSDDDINQPIRASSLSINFYQTEASADYSELYLAEDQVFRVQFYKNGSLFWQGWIASSLVAIPDESVPFPISLIAYDGLHLLENILFNDSDLSAIRNSTTDNRFDYSRLTDIFTKCLYKTGLTTADIYLQAELTNSETSNTSINFFDRTRMYHRSFIKDSKSMTCREVLKNQLSSLKCICYQRDGNWIITKVSDKTYNTSGHQASSVTSVSPSTLLPTAESTVDASAYNGTQTFNKVDGDATLTMQYPTNTSTVKHEHDFNFVHGDLTQDEVVDTSANGFYFWGAGSGLTVDASGADEVVVIKNSTNDDASGGNAPSSFIEIDIDGTITPDGSEDSFDSCVFIIASSSDLGYGSAIFKTDASGDFASIGFKVEFEARALDSTPSDSLRYYHGSFIRVRAYNSSDVLQTTRYFTANKVDTDASGNGVYYGDVGSIEFDLEPNVFDDVTYSTKTVSDLGAGTDYHVVDFFLCGTLHATGTPAYFDTSYHSISVKPLIKYPDNIEVKECIYKVVKNDVSYSFRYPEEKVEYGSPFISFGSNAFIAINGSGGDSRLTDNVNSYLAWTDGTFSDLTLQHFASLSKLLLYRLPVRRLDGTHYGDYKYGDLMSYDSGLNGTTGKFFPMSVSINFRKSRVRFSGDDLIDNSSLTTSQFDFSIDFIGKNKSKATKNI